MQTRTARGGAAATEAKAILDRCTEWADEMEAGIRDALETLPSKAVADAQIYMRTVPKRAASLKKELAELAKDPIVNKLATSRATLLKLSKISADTPNARKKLYGQAKMQLRQLSTLAVDEANEDYQDVKALWEAFAETMAPGKK
ncbi:MAG: hypothetical protein IJV69_00300 [Kiritimatiellae bacterium]|nr:hypothetical protein [Kiritimatiellia bacterium]